MLKPAIHYVGTALQFYKKQPLLNPVVGALLVAPYVLTSLVDMLVENFGASIQTLLGMTGFQVQVLYLIVQLVLALWILWGIATVLHIGLRLVKSAAGRTKTSFQSAAVQGRRHILPFFFTGLIRDCITLLLVLPYAIVVFLYLNTLSADQFNGFVGSLRDMLVLRNADVQIDSTISGMMLLLLPLLLPAIYYRITTSLYQMIMVAEKIEYRGALRKSATYIKTNFWTATLKMLTIMICTFVPIGLLVGFIEMGLQAFDPRLLPLSSMINGVGIAFATAIFSLAFMALYKDLLPTKAPAKKAAPRKKTTTKTRKK